MNAAGAGWRHSIPGYGFVPVAILLATALSLAAATPAAPDRPPTEYEVKAAYIYYFAKFVNWPEGAFPSRNTPIIIGISGDGEFAALLTAIVKDKTIQEHPISVRLLKSAADIQGCHIMYVGSSELKRSKPMMDSLRGQPTLTVTEADASYASKGIINLFMEGGKVLFEVDIPAAERARLQISSKLLRLSHGSTTAAAREQ